MILSPAYGKESEMEADRTWGKRLFFLAAVCTALVT
jgi:hypothetical protein